MSTSTSQSAATTRPGTVCGTCNKSFDKRYKLNRHVRIHTRPFKCDAPTCTYTERGFPTRQELERHKDDCHSENPRIFLCTVSGCNHKSKRKSNIKQHMDSQHRVSDNRSRRSGGNRNQSASSRAAQTRNVNTESQPEGGLVPPEQGDQQPDTTYTDATGPLISPVAQAMAPELAWRGYAARPQLHGSFSPYIYGTAPAFYEPRLPVSLGASAGFPLFASGRQLSQQSNFSIDSSFSDASSSGMGTGTGTGTGMSVICNMVLTPSSIADGYTTASTTPISGPVSSPSFQDQQQLNAYSPLYSTPLVVAPAPISQSQSSSLFETTAPAAPSVSVLISLHNVQPTHWPSVPIATAPAMENLLAEYTPDLFLPHTANDLGNFPGVDMSPTPYETF